MGEDFHSNPGLVNLFGIEFPDLNIKHSQLQNTLSRATAVGLRVHAPLQTYWMQSRIALSSALSGTTYGHRTTDQGLMTLIRQDTFCPAHLPVLLLGSIDTGLDQCRGNGEPMKKLKAAQVGWHTILTSATTSVGGWVIGTEGGRQRGGRRR
ncbi:uncharacterized protein [Triticum aestivum]|uniref:uncharacterized protein n=1 Tax=Triticum aestivum TaxID=4565 RepID=UPI001D0152CB|nr:uncharacterized protein LOC123167363 [Triticum aestivum]